MRIKYIYVARSANSIHVLFLHTIPYVYKITMDNRVKSFNKLVHPSWAGTYRGLRKARPWLSYSVLTFSHVSVSVSVSVSPFVPLLARSYDRVDKSKVGGVPNSRSADRQKGPWKAAAATAAATTTATEVWFGLHARVTRTWTRRGWRMNVSNVI